ncbi:MAG TPA: hypothetical protein V6D50_03500 [Chroococcales cyanobacterium]
MVFDRASYAGIGSGPRASVSSQLLSYNGQLTTDSKTQGEYCAD